jgi:hypothetical protein
MGEGEQGWPGGDGNGPPTTMYVLVVADDRGTIMAEANVTFPTTGDPCHDAVHAMQGALYSQAQHFQDPGRDPRHEGFCRTSADVYAEEPNGHREHGH